MPDETNSGSAILTRLPPSSGLEGLTLPGLSSRYCVTETICGEEFDYPVLEVYEPHLDLILAEGENVSLTDYNFGVFNISLADQADISPVECDESMAVLDFSFDGWNPPRTLPYKGFFKGSEIRLRRAGAEGLPDENNLPGLSSRFYIEFSTLLGRQPDVFRIAAALDCEAEDRLSMADDSQAGAFIGGMTAREFIGHDGKPVKAVYDLDGPYDLKPPAIVNLKKTKQGRLFSALLPKGMSQKYAVDFGHGWGNMLPVLAVLDAEIDLESRRKGGLSVRGLDINRRGKKPFVTGLCSGRMLGEDAFSLEENKSVRIRILSGKFNEAADPEKLRMTGISKKFYVQVQRSDGARLYDMPVSSFLDNEAARRLAVLEHKDGGAEITAVTGGHYVYTVKKREGRERMATVQSAVVTSFLDEPPKVDMEPQIT